MLNVARGKSASWERKLSKYGLSNQQFRLSGLQQIGGNAEGTFPNSHDPELGAHWKNGAMHHGLTSQDLSNMGRVPVRHTLREVPLWALSDAQCRILLLHLYPSLNKSSNNKYLAQCYAGTRRRAGRTALMIYRAYRQCYSDADIAAELGVSRAAVCVRLQKLKRAGRVLFEKANAAAA